MPPRTRAQRAAAATESSSSPPSRSGSGSGSGSGRRSSGRERKEEEGVEEEGMYVYLPRLPVLLALVAMGAAALAYRIGKGPFEPVLWQAPTPLAELAGPVLAPNHDLAGAEHLFRNRVVGPESIAIGGRGEIYLSLNDGRVVRTNAEFGAMTTVFFTGGVVKAEAEGRRARQQGSEDGAGPQGRHWHALPALPNGTAEGELAAWCTAEMQAYRFSTPTETTCGRPLGLRFVPLGGEDGGGHGLLYLADAYHGLFTLHTAHLTAKHLVQPKAPAAIPNHAAMHPGIGRPLRFTNDLDVVVGGDGRGSGNSGDVFFTDSTWAWSRAEHAVEIVDGAPRGRLLRYDGATGALEPMVCGLHFANGVQLLEGGRSLLVVESTRFRILKVDLDAWRRAAPETRLAALQACDEDAPRPPFVSMFVEGLPGLPDNLRLHEGAARGPLREGGVLLLGMGAKNTQPFALLQFLYQHRLLRLVLGALVPLKHFHTLVPKYGLAGVLSQDGQLLRLLQDPTGRTPFLSEVHVHPETGDLLLGSFRNRFLARVTLASLGWTG